MSFRPQEYFYLFHLIRWEGTAPPDGHMGTLNGRDVENSQTARMARLLTLIVAGNPADIDASFRKLERETRRRSDGNSYVSKDKNWMREPYEITGGWYFEGNMSLNDKQAIIEKLPRLGLISTAFVPCAKDFVAGPKKGKRMVEYCPSTEEGRDLLKKWKEADPSAFPSTES
jgi:hypothetical protein